MAASSTTYGKAVTETTTMAEAGGTTGVKTSMSTETTGMDKGTSGHNTRVTPDNATKTTVTTIQEISQNKLDCQVPEEEMQQVDRSDQFAETKSKGRTMEQLMERARRLEEPSNEMYQRIQRLECGNATSDSGNCRKEGVSSKGGER